MPKKIDKQSASYVMQARRFTEDGKLISETEKKGEISVHQFTTATAEIGVSIGGTVNLGNFESFRLDITCKMPSYVEELPEAYKFALEFADTRLNEELRKIQKAASEKATQDFSPF